MFISFSLPTTGFPIAAALSYRRTYRLPHRPIIPQSASRDDAFLHLRHRAISPVLLSISLGLPFLRVYERRKNRKTGTEKARETEPYERITRSGVVYSRLSKVKATENLAHTNQSTLVPRRRYSRERHPIHLGEITLYHGRPPRPRPRRWRAGHREKTDRRVVAPRYRSPMQRRECRYRMFLSAPEICCSFIFVQTMASQ